MAKVTVSTRGSHQGRRFGLSALLATLVVALCVGVFASVAGADDQGGEVSAAAVTSSPNNPLADHCGLNIVLVVDRSGSTKNFNSQYKDAAKTFVNALVGTPSQIGLVTFNDSATLRSGYKDVSATDNGLNSLIDGLPAPSGFTNWQDALEKTSANFAGPVPDLVLFITDGNPTTHNGGGGDDLTPAITAANTLKAMGGNLPHITGVAVGQDIDQANIAAITGAGAGLAGDPDVLTSSPDTIVNDLKELAIDLCGGTVTIHKQVRTGAGTVDSTTPALVDGWNFAAAGDGAPSGTTGTDGTGAVTLAFDNDHLGANTITESAGLAGYAIESVSCNDAAVDHTGSTFAVAVDESTVTSCTVVNAPTALGSIGVSKITTHGAGGPFTVNVSGPNTNSDLSGSTPGQNSSTSLGAAEGLYPGTYTIDETAMPEGWAFAGVQCDSGSVEGDVVTVQLGVGQDVSCTYTNDLVPSNLTIVKTAEEGTNTGTVQPIDYTLTVDNAGPADAHADATVVDVLPAAATFVAVDPPAGVTCDTGALPQISCTVPASMLEVSDPAVEIGVSVTVANGSGTVTNQSLVTSTDDPAPCVVSNDGITCSTVTDNFSEVSNSVPDVAGTVVTAPVNGPPTQVEAAQAALAFTGSNGIARLAGLAALLAAFGAAMLILSRKRKGLTE